MGISNKHSEHDPVPENPLVLLFRSSFGLKSATLLKPSRKRQNSTEKVPQFSRQRISKHVKEKKKVLFPDGLNAQSFDCAITSSHKSPFASKSCFKHRMTFIYLFLLCILGVGGRSGNDGSPQNTETAAQGRRGNRNSTQINGQSNTQAACMWV